VAALILIGRRIRTDHRLKQVGEEFADARPDRVIVGVDHVEDSSNLLVLIWLRPRFGHESPFGTW